MQNVNTALERRGEKKCLILTSYSICVPSGLTRVVAITFKALNKILSWCYHSNETSVTHLLHSTILFSEFYKRNLNVWIFPRAIIKSEKVKQQTKLSTDQHKKPSHDNNMQMMEKLTTSSRSHSRDNSSVQL